MEISPQSILFFWAYISFTLRVTLSVILPMSEDPQKESPNTNNLYIFYIMLTTCSLIDLCFTSQLSIREYKYKHMCMWIVTSLLKFLNATGVYFSVVLCVQAFNLHQKEADWVWVSSASLLLLSHISQIIYSCCSIGAKGIYFKMLGEYTLGKFHWKSWEYDYNSYGSIFMIGVFLCNELFFKAIPLGIIQIIYISMNYSLSGVVAILSNALLTLSIPIYVLCTISVPQATYFSYYHKL